MTCSVVCSGVFVYEEVVFLTSVCCLCLVPAHCCPLLSADAVDVLPSASVRPSVCPHHRNTPWMYSLAHCSFMASNMNNRVHRSLLDVMEGGQDVLARYAGHLQHQHQHQHRHQHHDDHH